MFIIPETWRKKQNFSEGWDVCKQWSAGRNLVLTHLITSWTWTAESKRHSTKSYNLSRVGVCSSQELFAAGLKSVWDCLNSATYNFYSLKCVIILVGWLKHYTLFLSCPWQHSGRPTGTQTCIALNNSAHVWAQIHVHAVGEAGLCCLGSCVQGLAIARSLIVAAFLLDDKLIAMPIGNVSKCLLLANQSETLLTQQSAFSRASPLLTVDRLQMLLHCCCPG